MFAVTYPSRAIGLLAPGIDRLPAPRARLPPARRPGGPGGAGRGRRDGRRRPTARPTFHVGLEWLAVGACLAVVAWRRNLFLGLVDAVAIADRRAGVAGLG